MEQNVVFDELFDIEAERQILGSMLLRQEAVEIACGSLEASDFHEKNHITIYDAIYSLYEAGTNIDTVTVLDKLGASKTEEIGGAAYLIELSNDAELYRNIQDHISIVLDKSKRRVLLQGLKDAAMSIRTGKDDYVKLAQDAIDASQTIGSEGIELAKDVLARAFHSFGDAEKNGIKTGFKGLDMITNGFRKKDLIILAARPSIGKTTFALNIATNIALTGRTVVYFTLESCNDNIAKRQLCYVAKVGERAARNMSMEEAERLVKAVGMLAETKMYYSEYTGSTHGIKADCKKVLRKEKSVDLIVIDYLSIMDIPQKRNGTLASAIGEITRKLKLLAKEMDAPVLLLAQLSRAIEKRSDPTPTLSDLKDSGSIEQDADVVLFIDRKREETRTNIIVAKQREGRLGVAELDFDGETYSFYDADLPKEM